MIKRDGVNGSFKVNTKSKRAKSKRGCTAFCWGSDQAAHPTMCRSTIDIYYFILKNQYFSV